MVNAVAHIDIKAPRLTKERFIAGGAAAVPVAGGVVLGIRFRFHNHAPEQAAVLLAFHQQAANQLRCNHLCWATEEGVREGLGKGGGYGSGCSRGKLRTKTRHSYRIIMDPIHIPTYA